MNANRVMKMRVLSALLLLVLPTLLLGQDKVTISGSVKDAETGEDVIGAAVTVPKLKTGANTNAYGFFSLTVPKGEHDVVVSYSGYQRLSQTVELKADTSIKFELEQFSTETVVVEGEATNSSVTSTQMGVESVTTEQIKSIPMLFGEADLIRAVQLLPGFQSAGDGNTGFNVRGGGVDQNLILLDEAIVYNPAHLLGFFSVFNADAIKDVDAYKSGFPTRFGGRLSSVLDIRMNDGNKKRFSGTGGIGAIASRLTLEGPIIKDKASFIVSGRRTYVDVFLPLSSNPDVQDNQLYFYDLNGKLNFDLGEKDRIFVSGYFGRDKLGLQGVFGFDWGNQTATARWNHIYNDKLFSNLTYAYTNFDYNIFVNGTDDDNQSFRLENGLQNHALKLDYAWYPANKHQVQFGVHTRRHAFQPGRFFPTGDVDNSIFNEVTTREKYGLESAAYIGHEWEISRRLSVNYGLRFSHFMATGPTTENVYGPAGPQVDGANAIDSTVYGNWEPIKHYINPEPRVAFRYLLGDDKSIKVAYDRMAQYINLMANTATTFPTDQWLPVGQYIEPQLAHQISLGYFQNFNKDMYEVSVEGYYKNLDNVIDFRDWANLTLNDSIEKEIRSGRGYSYGAEFMVKKTRGKVTGWLTYTYSRVFTKIEGINDGKFYPAANDRPHYITAVCNYKPHPRWDVGATFIFASGNPATFPAGVYVVNGIATPYFEGRNQYRIPAYHRMDASVTFRLNKNTEKRWNHSLNLSVYNLYSQKNPFAIDFRPSEDDRTKTEAVKIYLFPAVPSLTYNFNF